VPGLPDDGDAARDLMPRSDLVILQLRPSTSLLSSQVDPCTFQFRPSQCQWMFPVGPWTEINSGAASILRPWCRNLVPYRTVPTKVKHML
jgi:hypothetical protein